MNKYNGLLSSVSHKYHIYSMDSWRSVPFSRISTSTLSCACMAGAVKRAQNRSEEPRIILFIYMALCVIR